MYQVSLDAKKARYEARLAGNGGGEGGGGIGYIGKAERGGQLLTLSLTPTSSAKRHLLSRPERRERRGLGWQKWRS